MIDSGVFRGTLAEARAQKPQPRFYYSGVPCRRGHLSKRNVIALCCCECQKLYHDARQQEKRRARTERGETPVGPPPFVQLLADWTPVVELRS